MALSSLSKPSKEDLNSLLPRSPSPVSYTHLDVYKRQEYILLSLLVEYLSVSLKYFGGCSRHGTVDIHIYILQLFLIFRVLDVYKRQI